MKRIHRGKQSGLLRLILELPEGRELNFEYFNEEGKSIKKTLKCLKEA